MYAVVVGAPEHVIDESRRCNIVERKTFIRFRFHCLHRDVLWSYVQNCALSFSLTVDSVGGETSHNKCKMRTKQRRMNDIKESKCRTHFSLWFAWCDLQAYAVTLTTVAHKCWMANFQLIFRVVFCSLLSRTRALHDLPPEI